MVNSRRKGAAGEREAASEIHRLFGVEARRGRQYCGSDESPDVQAAIPNVHIEVKRVEALRLYPAVEQAVADAGGNIPVVLHRASQKPWLAIVRLDDLPRLVAQLNSILAETVQER
jgi:Holliday junction resolvase